MNCSVANGGVERIAARREVTGHRTESAPINVVGLAYEQRQTVAVDLISRRGHR